MDKLKEFVTMKNLFIVTLIAIIIAISNCSGPKEKITTIIQPEYHVVTDTVVLEKIKLQTIKVKDGTVIVNKDIYKDYIQAKDTSKKKEILIEAITIRDYKTNVIDNDTIKIDVNSKVQGLLLSTNADVTIKSQKIKERIITQRPKLSFILGAEVGYNNLSFTPVIKTGIQTKSGNMFTISADLNRSVNVGFAKTFTIIK